LSPDIEPDGQQFLDARGDEGREGPSWAELEPTSAKKRRSIALPVALAVGAVVVIGGIIAIFVVGGGGGVDDLTDVATGGNIQVGEREDPTTTTTEAPPTTATTTPRTTLPTTLFPPTTLPPSTVVVPVPGAGAPGQALPAPCPGGSVDTQLTKVETKRAAAGSNTWVVTASGTATSHFAATLRLDLKLVLAGATPGQVVLVVTPDPVAANGTATVTFNGQVQSSTDPASGSSITGSFSFSDPALAHCQSGQVG
jgi:hypothetical protein